MIICPGFPRVRGKNGAEPYPDPIQIVAVRIACVFVPGFEMIRFRASFLPGRRIQYRKAAGWERKTAEQEKPE